MHPALPTLLLASLLASARGYDWTRPYCFAYSPGEDGYACFDFAIGADLDPGLVDFERRAPVPDVAWHGRKAIALVHAAADDAEPDEIVIAEKPYDSDGPTVRHRSASAARRLARQRGYKDAPLSRHTLPSARWVRFRGVWLRFTTELREGDASAHAIGSLQLRCTADAEPVELLDRSYGEFAVAYAHRSAPSLVVGIRNWSGGEGSGYYTVEYVHIDLEARCPAAAQDHPHAGAPAARARP